MDAPELLQSKKFLASAVAAGLAFLCLRSGMSREDTAFVVGPLIAFVGMQGLADIGKGRAQVAVKLQTKQRQLADPPVQLTQATLARLLERHSPAPASKDTSTEGKA